MFQHPFETPPSNESSSQTIGAMYPSSHQPHTLTETLVTDRASTHDTSSSESESEVSVESDLSSSHGSDATGSSSRWDTFGLTSDTSVPSLPKMKERKGRKGIHKRYDGHSHKNRWRHLESESVSEVPAHTTAAPLAMDNLFQSQSVVVVRRYVLKVATTTFH